MLLGCRCGIWGHQLALDWLLILVLVRRHGWSDYSVVQTIFGYETAFETVGYVHELGIYFGRCSNTITIFLNFSPQGQLHLVIPSIRLLNLEVEAFQGPNPP